MIRSFGVARVMSVNRMQIFVCGLISSRNGLDAMGCASACITAAFSSAKPGVWLGSITVVRPSGNSTGNQP